MRSFTAGITTWSAISLLTTVIAQNQAPLVDSKPFFKQHESLDASSWKLNFSSEAPHFFASVYGLLQQWSNTFFPNGHSITPCEVPPFTKLYHGRVDADLPPSPEWLAFDIAMSYGIMGSMRNSHMLTYQTTKTAKCIYFDGESATLFGTGQLHSQQLHIWGNISGPPNQPWGLFGEYSRAKGLCKWLDEQKLGGPGWGYEGVVRMNAGFEMIWCNFSSPSIRLVSHLNVTAPLLPPSKTREEVFVAPRSFSLFPLPPEPTGTAPSEPPLKSPSLADLLREPFFRSGYYYWYLSSTYHYGSSGNGPGLGETRVRLSTCGFLSYYDPSFPSQAKARAESEQKNLNLTQKGFWTGPGGNGTRKLALEMLARRRRMHTLDQVTPSDAASMRLKSETVLRASLDSSYAKCSGIDWYILTNEIVQSHADRIFRLRKTLDKYPRLTSNSETFLQDWLTSVREQTHSFLLPFLRFPNDGNDEQDWASGSLLFQDVFSRCQFQHTRLLYPDQGLYLGAEESLLRWAVEDTQGSICSVLVDIGFSVEGIWAFGFSRSMGDVPAIAKSIDKEVGRWLRGVEELMAWLGWVGEWTDCEEKCAWDESCYIPMWPVIPRRGSGHRAPYGNGSWPGYGNFPYGPPYSFPGNGTRRSGYAFDPFEESEVDLWQPKCTKQEFFFTGKRT